MITTRIWDGDSYNFEEKYDLSSIDVDEQKFHYQYGMLRLTTTRPWELITYHYLGKKHFLVLKEFISKKVFDASTTFRSDRISLLKKIIDVTFDSTQNNDVNPFGSIPTISELNLFAEIYGYRIYNHPNFNEEYRKYSFLIESLRESGELTINGNNVKLTGKSIKTIADFELSERRHKDSKFHNWLLFGLTALIAISTVVQAYYSFVSGSK
jgi:hypothetical protein